MTEDFRSSRSRNARNLIILGIIVLIALISVAAVSLQSEQSGSKLPQGTVAKIYNKQGEVLIKRSGTTVPFEADFLLRSGDTIRSRKKSSLRIIYLDDKTEVFVEENTSILFDSNEGGKRLRISGGTARIAVPKQPEDQPMVLASNCAEATVLRPGTFELSMHGPQARYKVETGRLRIRRLRDAQIKVVKAGETYSAADSTGKITFGSIHENPLSVSD